MNVRTVFIYASGIGFGAILSLITLPILAWMFSPEDVGRVALFQLSLSLIVVFFSFGLDQSYVRKFNEVDDATVLARACIAPGLLLLLFSIIVACFYVEEISFRLFDIKDFTLFTIFCFSAIMLYLERFFSVFIRMKEMSFAYSMTRVLPKLLFLVLVASLFLFPEKKSFIILSGMQSISWSLVVIIMLFFLNDKYISFRCEFLESQRLKELISFGFPLMISGIAFWGLNFIDRIMLKEFSSLAQLGIYAVASTLAGAAILFQQIFTTMWHPLIYKWVSEDLAEGKMKGVADAVQVFSLLLICLAALFSFLISYFLPVEYLTVQFLLPACLVPPLYMMVTEVTGIGISISKKTKFLPVITIICMAVNLSLNYFLIPSFGAGGAAAATAISFFLYLILKTEMSNFLWVSFSNIKFYVCSILVILLSAFGALYGNEYEAEIHVAWFVILMICILSYIGQIQQFYVLAKGRF
ncbi:lipopolysaccharide biosynthesis protein [Pseudomonas sp. B21-010]|uniref:lipopolysaccharide biosynthesis protein n=1 Tax=Pseudomonas sp. B21-010 TaxID=2895471 RepID=UPI00215EF422|nr:oligosaccharide flippase family protein [Pseudomonas sp. B21-010]UVM63012.1 oligosaccharide flippase family protein [Pseudomonas sp. B21-010]